jgi:two-component system heavy metal sensor histidine kinase CusS
MSSKNDAEVPVQATPPSAQRPWSLAARLTAWYAASTFLLVVGVTGFLYWVLTANLDREDNEVLADRVHLLRKLLHERPEDIKSLKLQAEQEWAAYRYTQLYVRIVDDKGNIILDTPGMGAELAPALFRNPVSAAEEPRPAQEHQTRSGQTFLLVSAEARTDHAEPWIIHLAFDRTYEENLLARYRRNLWFVLAVALIVCTTVGYWIARRGLRPVEEITATARRIRSTTLNERIETARFPAELATLAATFNEMLDRLEESFSRLARFSADIAHELRTPVNNLRGEAEVALAKARSPEEYRDVLGSCLEECLRLTQLINSLLFLARAESPHTQISREIIDVGRELAAVRDFYEPAAGEAGIELKVQAADSSHIQGDRTLLQRALGNLVANSLAHTKAGGVITLSATATDGAVEIVVADSGCGIAPEHLPHVFDRFYRVDQARSNAGGRVGLGLAIVKSIAALHGGDVSIHSEPGKGTRVVLRLAHVGK